jgi:type III secretion system YscQ/HrcQ family protein
MNSLPLRTVSPTEAESLSLVAQRATDLPLPRLLEDDEQATLSASAPSATLRPLQPAGQRSVPTGDLVMHLQWSGARFMLAVPSSVVAALLRHWCADAPLDGMPPGWRAALDHLLSDWVCAAVEALGRGRPELLELQRAKPGMALPSLAHAFELGLEVEALGISGAAATLYGDSLGLHLMAGLCQTRSPVRQSAAVRDTLPCTLAMTVGWTRLPAHTVRRLRPGHLVFVEQALPHAERQLWLALAAHDGRERGFIARHEDLSITLLRGPMESINQTDEYDAAAGHDELQDIDAMPVDQLPVKLSFDCGSVTLTLSQVEQLAAGQVIPTARALDDYVSIRANGAVIGRGVLMQVDGRLAVSITQLSAPAGDGRSAPEGAA